MYGLLLKPCEKKEAVNVLKSFGLGWSLEIKSMPLQVYPGTFLPALMEN